MHKYLFVSLFCLLTKTSFTQHIDIIRNAYIVAGENRQTTPELIALIEKYQDDTNCLMQAYLGTALAMKAEITKGKYNQYMTFINGKKILEEAINLQPELFEIRFLRFQVQENIPSVLLYDNRSEDKTFLLTHLRCISEIKNKEFSDMMLICLLSSKFLTEYEKKIIRNYINSEYGR